MSQTGGKPNFDSAVGWQVGRQVIRVERAPLARFALAIEDDSEVFQDLRAAQAAGFSCIPAPTTFPFAMGYWGTLKELQPEAEPSHLDLPAELSQLGHIGVVMAALMEALGPGLVLHAEQEFDYRRPVVAGDVLNADTSVTSVDTKHSKNSVLTFVAITTAWTDANSGDLVLSSTFTAVHQAGREQSRALTPEGSAS